MRLAKKMNCTRLNQVVSTFERVAVTRSCSESYFRTSKTNMHQILTAYNILMLDFWVQKKKSSLTQHRSKERAAQEVLRKTHYSTNVSC